MPGDWRSEIDERSGHRYYVNSRTGASQWEYPTEEISERASATKPVLLFDRHEEEPKTAATTLLSQLKKDKLTNNAHEEIGQFSTAFSNTDALRAKERKEKAKADGEAATSAGMFLETGGALGFVWTQQRAATVLQANFRGRQLRKKQKKAMKDKVRRVNETS